VSPAKKKVSPAKKKENIGKEKIKSVKKVLSFKITKDSEKILNRVIKERDEAKQREQQQQKEKERLLTKSRSSLESKVSKDGATLKERTPRLMLPRLSTRIEKEELPVIEDEMISEVQPTETQTLNREIETNIKEAFKDIDLSKISLGKKRKYDKSYSLNELKQKASKLGIYTSLNKKDLVAKIFEKARELGISIPDE
jgi:hypothetical protein